MPLVVEDGSCVATANAFVTRSEFTDWAEDYRPDLDVGSWSGDDIDAAIQRASSWISTFPNWDGSRKCGRSQGLAWPRTGVTDCDGNTVPDDEVPDEVKFATYAAAIFEYQNVNALTPNSTPGEQVKSVTVDVISQTFMTPQEQGIDDQDPLDAIRPMVAQVKDYLRCMASFPNESQKVPYPFVV